MSKSLSWVLLVLAFGVGLPAQTEADLALGHMREQVILRFRRPTSAAAERSILARWSLRPLLRLPLSGTLLLATAHGADVKALARTLGALPEVEFAQTNDLGSRAVVPNDPQFGLHWGLDNVGQTVSGDPGSADRDIDAPEAWSILHDATAITLAVVDSGCRISHQDLGANIWVNPFEIAGNGIDDDGNGFVDDVNGWDFLGNDNSPSDSAGHGTAVVGTAAMRGNNGLGGTGVCWEARVMILRDGNTAPQVALTAAGIEYAAAMGARVCNVSSAFGSGPQPALQLAVDMAQSADMLLCVAAGNAGISLDSTASVPATFTNDNIICVGATDNDDAPASFSNFGVVHVDLFAPGVAMYSTGNFTNSSYAFVNGTSFSAPIATGAVALLRALAPAADYLQVRSALLGSVDPVPALSGLAATGGRLNLHAAMLALAALQGAPGPDPMQFAVPPHLISNSLAAMTAATATPAPVEYRFDLVSATAPGGDGSNWQATASFSDSGLMPGSHYVWTCRARNAASLAQTSPSAALEVWTPANPPTSLTVANVTNGDLDVVAIGSNGNPPSVEYAIQVGSLFAQVGGGLGPQRSWQTATQWSAQGVSGLAPETSYSLRVRARSGNGMETIDSAPIVVQTKLLGACAAGVIGLGTGGPFSTFLIAGSDGGGARLVSLTPGSSFTVSVLTPPTSDLPTQHALIGYLGVPTQTMELVLPAGIGTLCFTPCGFGPPSPAFTVESTFGPAPCGTLTTATLTPWSFFNPGYPFPLPDITFQVVSEEIPGLLRVGNAIVLRYQ